MPKNHFIYPPGEVQRRFQAWSSLPTQDPQDLARRHAAWNRYCDARDSVPEGTSAANHPILFLAPALSAETADQLDMFGGQERAHDL